MQAILVSDTKPKGDMMVNYLDLSALLVQVQLFSPKMDTSAHIHISVNKTEAQGWSNHRSVRSATAVGPIFQDLSLMMIMHKIYSSVQRISGTDNKMTDVYSRLTHLTDKMFLHNFALRKAWRLLTLPSGCRRRLNSMLNRKCCRMASQTQSSKNYITPGTNGASSANG